MAHQGYGFCEFLTEEDAEYACKIMNQIKLWGKPIRVNKVSSLSGQILWNCGILTGIDSVTSSLLPRCALPTSMPIIITADETDYHEQASSDKKQLDVGANLFIGSLDESVDERLLYDTFSAFGMMATTAKVRVTSRTSRVVAFSDGASDCSGSWHRSFEGIWLRFIYRL